MSDVICNSCGAPEGHLHRPECTVWAEMLITDEKYDRTKYFIDQAQGSEITLRQDYPINLVFHDEGEEIGKFEWNRTLKKWQFTGNMDEAAKQFAKFMYAHFESLMNGDRDGLMNEPPRKKSVRPRAEESVFTSKVMPHGLSKY